MKKDQEREREKERERERNRKSNVKKMKGADRRLIIGAKMKTTPFNFEPKN